MILLIETVTFQDVDLIEAAALGMVTLDVASCANSRTSFVLRLTYVAKSLRDPQGVVGSRQLRESGRIILKRSAEQYITKYLLPPLDHGLTW